MSEGTTFQERRNLSDKEIEAVNRIGVVADEAKTLVETLYAHDFIDERGLEEGRTHLQTGFMWLVRAVARPPN